MSAGHTQQPEPGPASRVADQAIAKASAHLEFLDRYIGERSGEAARAIEGLDKSINKARKAKRRHDRTKAERVAALDAAEGDAALAKAQQAMRRWEKRAADLDGDLSIMEETRQQVDDYRRALRAMREAAGQDAITVGLALTVEQLHPHGAGHVERAEAARLAASGALPDSPQQTPSALQAGRRGVVKFAASGAAILGADVPEAVRRMRKARLLDQGQVEALARWRDDLAWGTARAALTQSYEVRVQGGGNASGDVALSKIEAMRRWEAANARLQPGQKQVLEWVMIQEGGLEGAPGVARLYGNEGQKRAAAGTELIGAAEILRAFYGFNRAGT